MPKLSIIICMYNEKASALPVIDKVRSVSLSAGWSKEIIVVDNCSIDGTRELLQQLPYNDVRVIYQPRNLGKGASIRTGFREAIGEYGVIQDADFEYDPAELSMLTAKATEAGVVAVFGSRTAGGRHIYKYKQNYWGVKVLTSITNILFGGHLTDVAVATKMVKRSVFQSLDLKGSSFDLDFELPCKLLKRKHSIAEVPVSYKPRTIAEGKKIRWTDGLHALAVIFRERFTK
ncbi:MAG TPA: glycosyltransferase family 2 protein [Anaerolineae bacterium]|nr:glycosyltransferase family 2 protein [Anaerolineae bacterium]